MRPMPVVKHGWMIVFFSGGLPVCVVGDVYDTSGSANSAAEKLQKNDKRFDGMNYFAMPYFAS